MQELTHTTLRCSSCVHCIFADKWLLPGPEYGTQSITTYYCVKDPTWSIVPDVDIHFCSAHSPIVEEVPETIECPPLARHSYIKGHHL